MGGGQIYNGVWRDYVYIHRESVNQNCRSNRVMSDLSVMSQQGVKTQLVKLIGSSSSSVTRAAI